jgi:histidine ammonia-lyase
MELTGEPLSLTQIAEVAIGGANVGIAASAHARIHASRRVIEEILKSDAVVYGINTGFGRLADVQIERGDVRQLQLNLVRSHACGVGAPLRNPKCAR